MRLKRFWIKIALVASMAYGTLSWAEDITFRQALDQMMEQNPVLNQRKLGAEISKRQRNQAKAAYLPQIDFMQSWSRSNNPVYVFGTLLNQERFGPANFAIDELNHPSELSDFSSRFQMGWLLFDFGKRESQMDSSETRYRIASLQEQNTRLILLEELVRRYYAVSLAQRSFGVAQAAVASAESRLQQAKDRVSAGQAVESDELAAEVFHARRIQERIDADNRQKLSQAALQELLGAKDDQALTTVELKESSFQDHPLSWWEGEMKENRPEIKLAAEGSRLAQEERRMQQSNLLPSIQAWSGYEWHGSSLDYTGGNWGVGMELRWNLFRGFSDHEQLSAAKMQEQLAFEKQRQADNELELQLKQAYYSFQSAKEKLLVAAATLQQASESRRIYADRYSSGLVTIQDSLQAETSYNETQLLYSQNLYDLYVAYASLLAASGNEAEMKTVGVQP